MLLLYHEMKKEKREWRKIISFPLSIIVTFILNENQRAN